MEIVKIVPLGPGVDVNQSKAAMSPARDYVYLRIIHDWT